MDDLLKKFIQQHREDFDNEEPSRLLFGKIDQHLHQDHKKKQIWQLWRWAAIVTGFLILSATIYLVAGKNKKPDQTDKTTVQTKPQENNTNQDINLIGDASYAKQIDQFQEIIVLKQEELKELRKEYPELYHQFVKDINELDSNYQSLKTKLAANPNREMLLEAMIQNLQLQSELLNKQLMIIKEIKQKTKSHEKSTV